MSYSPKELQQLLQQRKFKQVESSISEFINMSANKENFIKLATPVGSHNFSNSEYEQQCVNSIGGYASVIVQLFCHEQYRPQDNFLNVLIVRKEILEMIFLLSPWKSTDPIIEKLNLLDSLDLKKNPLNSRNKTRIKSLLALFTLESKYSLPWADLFKSLPQLSLLPYLGLLNHYAANLRSDKSEKYNALLEQAQDFPMVAINNQDIASSLAGPYFYCSYATSENKYAFKKWAAKLLAYSTKRWVSKDVYNYSNDCQNKPLADKPKMLVVLEHYYGGHAMFRSFNAKLASLADDYELVAMAETNGNSEADLSVFAKIIEVAHNEQVSAIVEKVTECRPDILLYPSLGMKTWTICMASLRLAPVQVMMGGHPSSSYSDVMDYFIIPVNCFQSADIQPYINEKVVMDEHAPVKQTIATRHIKLTDEFIHQNNQYESNPDTFVIGINGVINKVSTQVIDYCQTISSLASKPVKFLFFSSYPKNHIMYIVTKLQLQALIPNFELAGYSDYLSYLSTVSQCHLLLPTFPFGGSNSNVDAMVLKKPKLFLNGQEQLYTRTDFCDWTRIGMADKLACNSTEELIKRALELIENEDKRKQLHDSMVENCTLERIFHSEESMKDASLIKHFALIKNEYHEKTELVTDEM